MGRPKSRWQNQLQNYWTSEKVSKSEKCELGGGRKKILYEAKAVFIKRLLSTKGEIITAVVTKIVTAVANIFLKR